MKHTSLFPVFAAAALLAGCATETQLVDTDHDTSPLVNALDSRDFSRVAEKMIADMIESGALDKPNGGRYIVAISRVANRTKQDIDTDQLVKIIRVALLKSKKAVVSTAISGSGPEDNMSNIVRDLADEDMGGPLLPELSLSGKIVERNLKIDRSKQRIEYIFELSLTDVRTGVAFWENQEPIIKIGKR